MQTSLRPSVSTWSLDRLGGLERQEDLQALIESVFGRGDRPTGWFSRKLRRECVDPAVSAIATTGRDPLDAGQWCGCILIGRPPSFGSIACTVSVAVKPDRQQRGIGTRMLQTAMSLLSHHGVHVLRTMAAPARASFYLRQGYVHRQTLATVMLSARGSDFVALPPPRPWTPPAVRLGHTHESRIAWLEEGWTRTEAHLRHTLDPRCGATEAHVHLSREGRAFLVHRLLAAPQADPTAILQQVARRLPRGAPLLVPRLSASSGLLRDLRAAGGVVVQRGHELELDARCEALPWTSESP